MKEEGFHPPLEEYLEAIHTLSEEGAQVIQARIAERIQKSAPSVSEMLGKLEEDGYINRSGRKVSLTKLGKTVASKVVRKHRLAERLLVDVIGLEWHKAHIEAGRWEHVISDEVEEKLVVLLGNPSTCPHGNPIPGTRSNGEHPKTIPLSKVKIGSAIKLYRVTEEVEIDNDMMSNLGEMGFIVGSKANVISRISQGDIELEVMQDKGSTKRGIISAKSSTNLHVYEG